MKNASRIVVLASLVSSLLAPPASAQGAQERTVARLKEIVGNVLVSQPTGLAAAVPAQRLAKGARIITTANSEALVAFDNGCEVRVRENQRFEVEEKPCEALMPASFGDPALAAGALGLAGLITPLAVVGSAILVGTGGGGPTPVSPN